MNFWFWTGFHQSIIAIYHLLPSQIFQSSYNIKQQYRTNESTYIIKIKAFIQQKSTLKHIALSFVSSLHSIDYTILALPWGHLILHRLTIYLQWENCKKIFLTESICPIILYSGERLGANAPLYIFLSCNDAFDMYFLIFMLHYPLVIIFGVWLPNSHVKSCL